MDRSHGHSERGKSDISILNPTKRGRTFIRDRNRECSSAARTFTQQTAASIAIANKSAPITIADDIERKWGNRRSAPRDYIFERPVFLGKMRMGQDLANIGARAPAAEESPAPAGAASPAARQAAAASPAAAQAASPSSGSSPATAPARRPALRLPARLRQMHRRRQDSAPASLHRPPDKWRTPLPEEAALPHRARRLPAHHGRSKQPACRRCILPRGIMCIFTRRAASILIQTCRRTVSSTKNDASPDERSAEAVQLSGSDAPPEGWEVVPTYDAKCRRGLFDGA